MSTVRIFRDLLAQRPFKPFRLVMSSGQSYDVLRPEMALLTRTEIVIGVDVADDGIPARFRICPLFDVTGIQAAGPANEAGSK